MALHMCQQWLKLKSVVAAKAEPTSEVAIESFIDKAAPQAKFHEPKFNVRAVLAKRTFIEKLFLLHEEFCKSSDQIRVARMSRHLYDVHRIQQTPIAYEALLQLQPQIINHLSRKGGKGIFSCQCRNLKIIEYLCITKSCAGAQRLVI